MGLFTGIAVGGSYKSLSPSVRCPVWSRSKWEDGCSTGCRPRRRPFSWLSRVGFLSLVRTEGSPLHSLSLGREPDPGVCFCPELRPVCCQKEGLLPRNGEVRALTWQLRPGSPVPHELWWGLDLAGPALGLGREGVWSLGGGSGPPNAGWRWAHHAKMTALCTP